MDNDKNQFSHQLSPASGDHVTILYCTCGHERTVIGDKTYKKGRFHHECSECEFRRRILKFGKVCPPLYLETKTDKLPAKQYEQVMKWEYGPTGLILSGDTGLGKTRCAWELIKRIMVDDQPERTFFWFDCCNFGHELEKHYRDGDCDLWVKSVAEKGLVFFDDFGKFKLTERVEVELFGVIENRVSNKLPILITTNDHAETFYDRVSEHRGPAMIRRLREFCSVIKF